MQVCSWVPSGDGEILMNAIMVHNYQVGGIQNEQGEWVTGWIAPSTDSDPGLHCNDQCFQSYKVLIASTLPCTFKSLAGEFYGKRHCNL